MTSIVNLTDFCSQSSGDIKFIFIKDTDDNSQNHLDNVIAQIKELHPEQDIIDVITSDECFEIDEHESANKRFIFVFDKFDTPAFNHISQIVGVYILGPKCVMSVIHENLEIPGSLFHINNLCMKDLILCFSSIGDPEKKSRMKRLIGYMGGLYSNSLTEDITHLVTEDIFSKKYHHAGGHNIKIMHTSWIEELWKMSQYFNFNQTAISPEITEKYQLKMFNRLVFSSTGLDNEEKKKAIKIIEENGGEYSHTFKTATVKVLLMRHKDIGSVKYKASTKHSIHCLDPNWIIDSAAAGYALNIETYIIKKEGKLKSSTPTKNTSALGKFAFDNTMISEICDFTARSIAIDETQKSSLPRASVNIQQNLFNKPESAARPSTSLRSSRSNTSIKTKESTFKKPTAPSNKKKDSFAVPSPPRFEYTEDASDESFIQILIDKTVCVYGYSSDIDSMQVIKECEKLGAKLVDLSYNKTVDYVITTTEVMEIEMPKLKYKNLVSDVWLEESVEIGRCIEPLKFYHYSLFKHSEKCEVLKDEIFVCSNYESHRQRPFIRFLVKELGGICKEALSRSEGPILICPSAEGKKYDGARHWGLTVLKADWLMECYRKKVRVDESEYLVGNTKASIRNIKKRDSIIPSSQDMSVDSSEVCAPNDSPEKRPNIPVSPQTPTTPNAMMMEDENEKIGNLSWLLEDMPTPQRVITRAVLMEQQKKNKVSPRTKLLKDLMQTPGNVQKSLADYVPSPAPDLPASLLPPKEGNYALDPDASPASQWYYKRKLEALDDRYVHISESQRKELRNLPVTPKVAEIRHNFFKKRLTDYDSPDPRHNVNQTDRLFTARASLNMSKEASKFLNFEDTEEADGTNTNNPQNSDIIKLDELLKRNNSQEKNLRRSSSAPQSGESEHQKNKKIIDFDPKSPDFLVRWSNTQVPSSDSTYSHELQRDEIIQVVNDKKNSDNETENILIEDSPVDVSQIDEEYGRDFVFAISSGMNGEDKLILTEKIEQLGGTVTEHDFTHLIMTKMSKSSKFFSALCSGKFILHSSYIDECLLHKRFIKTDSFEFGNPQFKCKVTSNKEPELFEGPYRCRMLVKNNPEKYANGLFTGLNFIIVASNEKAAQFVHVIESGGGTIIDEKPEFKVSVLKRCKVDYCLMENVKGLSKKDVDTLKSCNIAVKNVKFIYEYLLNDNNR